MKRKILYITGSRAEYGILKNLFKLSLGSKYIEPYLLVFGNHNNKDFGSTINEIRKDNIKINFKINVKDNTNNQKGAIKLIAKSSIIISDYLMKLKPYAIFVTGDRYELLSAVYPAIIHNISIFHLHGGEVTLGSFDNYIRNSISMMSTLHFTATKKSKERLVKMGVHKSKIFHVGSPSIDPLFFPKLKNKNSLIKELKIKFNVKNILVTYHIETINIEKNKNEIKVLMQSLMKLKDTNIFFTGVNSDPKSLFIKKEILKKIKNNSNFYYFSSLGRTNYFSMIYYSDIIMGNSSSGLIEVPFLKKPTINIGKRQEGREVSKSVIHSNMDENEILKKIKYVYSKNFQKKLIKITNPYFRKNSNNNIIKILEKTIV